MPSALHIAQALTCHAVAQKGSLTPLKLQKMLYYAQGWHMALHGAELFPDELEAWAHGPVCPEVYHAFKGFGFNPIPAQFPVQELPEFNDFITKLWTAYGPYSAKSLEEMTHQETPWLKSYDGSRCKIIPKELIRSYFSCLARS